MPANPENPGSFLGVAELGAFSKVHEVDDITTNNHPQEPELLIMNCKASTRRILGVAHLPTPGSAVSSRTPQQT
jgi:hypothetical protein